MSYFFGMPAMLALDALMIVYTIWAISLMRASARTQSTIAVSMFVWLGLLFAGLSTESVFADDISGAAFFGVVLAAVAAVGGLLLLVAPIRQFVLGLDQQQLLLFQGIRVYFGATFLIQGGLGILPSAFGVIDGLTHISAGFFALIAAFSVASGVSGRRRAWFANLFGLADILIVATSLAFVLLPQIGPHHPMMYAVFLPAPLWLWAHVVSIWKLVREQAESRADRIPAEVVQ